MVIVSALKSSQIKLEHAKNVFLKTFSPVVVLIKKLNLIPNSYFS